MSNLTFVGLSDDGAALILSSPQGDRFRLAIDERLRSAVRSGRAQLAAVDGPIGAKEIQARLRAGATPSEVAEFSGWTVDRVEAFAAPILQERSWVAEQAQKCQVGRTEEAPTLGELTERRLSDRGIDPDTVRWDAWRREDGEWTVLMAYPSGKGDRVATWQFDVAAMSLVAEDDEAHWFNEDPAEQQRPRLLRVPDDDTPRSEAVSNHPAGRNAAEPALQPAEPVEPAPQTAEPASQARPAAAPAAESDSPRWDEVLFGSPVDDK